MSDKTVIDLIEKGLKVSHRRMLEEKAKNEEDIIISANGKIIRRRAKDVLSELLRKDG
jgi:hypothetical protein